jgi:hypothetical protein
MGLTLHVRYTERRLVHYLLRLSQTLSAQVSGMEFSPLVADHPTLRGIAEGFR